MTKIVFITGGSASGKTSLAEQIKKSIGDSATIISQDRFYKSTSDEKTNYDIPSAFDWELQHKVFNDLKQGKDVTVPIYDYTIHARNGEETIKAGEVIIFEGLFTFHDQELTKLADLKIYVDTPSDTRLARRILRDINERKRDINEVINRWEKDVQSSFIKYISPLKYRADLIIPWQKVSTKGIETVIATIHSW